MCTAFLTGSCMRVKRKVLFTNKIMETKMPINREWLKNPMDLPRVKCYPALKKDGVDLCDAKMHPAESKCVACCAMLSCSVMSDSLRPHQAPLSTGILQARIVRWVAVSSSGGSSQRRDPAQVFCSSCTTGRFFTAETLGKPIT